eukprot:Lithocolla_globosa_v1_NODE_2636_length_1925_cov_8.858289.p2 type:complete len:132 gc:universal NODE_2636_length_1925_cov_8.858289:1428-1033(-)
MRANIGGRQDIIKQTIQPVPVFGFSGDFTLKIMTQAETIKKAIKVPIETISAKTSISKKKASIPDTAPVIKVPQKGVSNLGSTLRKISNISPSRDMARKIRGIPSMLVIMVVVRAIQAPKATIMAAQAWLW